MPAGKARQLLTALTGAGVDFVLVGGVAAVLNGAPINTFDVDIVHAPDPENLNRLLPVLKDLEAVFRVQPERRLQPDMTHLTGPRHLNLVTRLGPLDLLGPVGPNLAYADLLQQSRLLNLGDGLTLRVLELDALIQLKEEAGSAKNAAILPILRQTLKEQRKTR